MQAVKERQTRNDSGQIKKWRKRARDVITKRRKSHGRETRVGCILLYLAEFYIVLSESRCTLRLRCVDLVVSFDVAIAVCSYFTEFSC
jgi:hypothetical protein